MKREKKSTIQCFGFNFQNPFHAVHAYRPRAKIVGNNLLISSSLMQLFGLRPGFLLLNKIQPKDKLS